jgi:integrase
VGFTGPAGRVQRSTCESALRPAEESAQAIIAAEFTTPVEAIAWDVAIEAMVKAMQAENLRSETIAQYRIIVGTLRKAFKTRGPSDVTPAMAQRFKVLRSAAVAPRTVAGNITNLSIVFGKWFRDTLHVVADNPFDIDPPKLDQPKPRIITENENAAWVKWLSDRWPGWRLPLLFLEIKAATGCRISELCSATTLKDGRIIFMSETTKGRRERAPLLPVALYRQLKRAAGPTYLFERFAAELKERHSGRAVGPFKPKQLKKWFERQLREYRKANPKAKRFKLHNYRATAISRARAAGIAPADAAIAFGVDPKTAQRFYTSLDETAISDAVFRKLIDK